MWFLDNVRLILPKIIGCMSGFELLDSVKQNACHVSRYDYFKSRNVELAASLQPGGFE